MTHRPMAAGVALDPVRDAALIGEIIQMALSDHVGFAEIRAVQGPGARPGQGADALAAVTGQLPLLASAGAAVR